MCFHWLRGWSKGSSLLWSLRKKNLCLSSYFEYIYFYHVSFQSHITIYLKLTHIDHFDINDNILNAILRIADLILLLLLILIPSCPTPTHPYPTIVDHTLPLVIDLVIISLLNCLICNLSRKGYGRRILCFSQDTYLQISTPVSWKTCCWVYKFKIMFDGSLDHCKIYIFYNVLSQKYGMVLEKIFAIVAKMISIRTLIPISLVCRWQIFQMNVKNIFLNSNLHRRVYMVPLPNNSRNQGKTYKLKKTIYNCSKWQSSQGCLCLYCSYKFS